MLIVHPKNWHDKLETSVFYQSSEGHLNRVDFAQHDEVTIDLHIGAQILDYKSTSVTGDITIGQSEYRVVRTKEKIHTGAIAYGIIHSRASLAARGVLVSNLKVDPKFNGHIYVTVFNAGQREITLKRDEAFCSLSLGETNLEPDRTFGELQLDAPNKTNPIVRYALRNHLGIIAILLAAASALLQYVSVPSNASVAPEAAVIEEGVGE